MHSEPARLASPSLLRQAGASFWTSAAYGQLQERTCSNALALARTLAAHPKVARVYYPGLPEHPQHARATELFRHYGGLLSFELVDGADYVDMLNHLRYAVRATHLGDTRTLVIPKVTGLRALFQIALDGDMTVGLQRSVHSHCS